MVKINFLKPPPPFCLCFKEPTMWKHCSSDERVSSQTYQF